MHKFDDDFLCKTNDRIDNAVYAVICAVAAGEDAKDTIQAAIDTIACDKYAVTDRFCQSIIKEAVMALAEVGWLVENKLEDKRMGYEVGVPDWSIQVIGDLRCRREFSVTCIRDESRHNGNNSKHTGRRTQP